MKVVVTGSSGLIGSALLPFLRQEGHEVLRLVRGEPAGAAPAEAGAIAWDPKGWKIDLAALSGVEAVVHLAGAPIAGGRWSAEQKELIRQSRVDSTRFLAQTLAGLTDKPKVLISASAVGFYGDRGEEELDESSEVGFGFLSEVCRQWESAAEAAQKAGIRVVHPRIGVVLARQGGALEKMVTPFRLGLGATLGSGAQWMSCVHLQDLLRLLVFCLDHDELVGPVAAVAPQPLRQRDFAAAVARAFGRKARLKAPGWALRALLGEMAEELLLASTRVVPRRLLAAGFEFHFPNIDAALVDTLRDS